MTAGYSATPLAKKLSLKDGIRLWADAMPASVRREIERQGLELEWLPEPLPPVEAAHVFTRERTQLQSRLAMILPLLERSGFIWISWPKRASKVPTDISEGTIRDVALPMGLLDVKVCAVDDIWSGLKLVIRKELR